MPSLYGPVRTQAECSEIGSVPSISVRSQRIFSNSANIIDLCSSGNGNGGDDQADAGIIKVGRLAEMRAALKAELDRIDGGRHREQATDNNVVGREAQSDQGDNTTLPSSPSSLPITWNHSNVVPVTGRKKSGRLVDRLVVVAEAGAGGAGGLAFVSKYR